MRRPRATASATAISAAAMQPVSIVAVNGAQRNPKPSAVLIGRLDVISCTVFHTRGRYTGLAFSHDDSMISLPVRPTTSPPATAPS